MKKIATYFFVAILLVSTLYSQNEEKNRQVQNFKDKYPGKLSIQWDKTSGGPSVIMGSDIYLKTHSVNKTNIQALTENFISENTDLLNIRNTEMKLENIAELKNKFIVTYQQLYKKIPLWNVKLKLKVSDNGQVLMIKSPCFDNPNTPVQPQITLSEAKKNAAVNFNTDVKKVKDGEILIYPDKETGKLYLCWHVKIESDGINKGIMIDAQTGKKIFEYDLYRNAEIRGTVRSTTWSLPGQLGGSPNITPYCQDLKVNVTGVGSVNTNSSGYYSVTVPGAGNYTVTSNLDGPHCYVLNYAGSEASYSNTASTSSDHNWTWQESAHYNEYFVSHYMNSVWHEYNDKVSGFSSNYWYNNKMEGWANEDFDPGHANGYSTGLLISMTPLNHYGGSVYHEYSHNVIYQANGFWLGTDPYADGSAMDEGLSDYYSCSFRNDPLRYAVSRRLDTKMKYPGSGEAHTRGQIIGGACWDLGSKSGLTLDYVNGLVYESVTNIGADETFGNFMDEILSADDNDGNIFNGTPHDDQIFDAFVNDHAIVGSYLAGNINTNVSLVHNAVLLGDVYINNGSILTITNGVTVDLNGYSIILTDGFIDVNGTINGLAVYLKNGTMIKGLFSTIQSAIDNSSSGQTIELLATTYNVTVNITDLDNRIIKGQGNGTVINGNINLTNSDYIYIQDLKLGSSYKISSNNSYPIISNLNTDNDDGTSISAYGYGSFDIDSWSSNGYDTIDPDLYILVTSGGNMQNSDITGQEMAVYINNGASFHTDNNYYCSNGMDLWVQSGMAHAVDNTFSRDPSSSNYGFVVYGGTSSICDDGMPKRNMLASNVKNYKNDPAYSDYTSVDSSLLDLIVKVNSEARTDKNMDIAKYKSEYNNVISKFKGVLVKYPESDLAKYILSKITSSYIQIKDFENLRNYIEEIAKDKKYGKIKQYADRQMVSYYTSTKDYERALGATNEIMALNNLDTELTDELLYEKGIIYEYILNNNKEAEQCFSAIVKNNVNYNLINLASYQLKNMGMPIGKGKFTSSTSAKEKVELSNYPNPFNPTTMISYTLKEKNHVTLVVFDILGKEVARLIDGIQTEGEHSISFDGGNLPSGMYIYQLKGTNFNISKKMLMIK